MIHDVRVSLQSSSSLVPDRRPSDLVLAAVSRGCVRLEAVLTDALCVRLVRPSGNQMTWRPLQLVGLSAACCEDSVLCLDQNQLLCFSTCSFSQTWLKNYGYLLPHDVRTSDLRQEKAMQSAVAAMQRFYGIPVTGILDETTIE